MVLTLLVKGTLLSLAFGFGLSLVRDLAGHGAGHVQLVDVQGGLTEGGHGGVHACIAIGGAAERGQVQGFAPCNDGDVERELAAAVGRGRLGDGERRGGGELAAGTRRRGWLAVEEFVALAAGEEKLQRAAEKEGMRGRRTWKEVCEKDRRMNICNSCSQLTKQQFKLISAASMGDGGRGRHGGSWRSVSVHRSREGTPQGSSGDLASFI